MKWYWIVLIVIGALIVSIVPIGFIAYFGVFSPGAYVSGNYTSNQCVLNAPLGCNHASITPSNDGIILELTNGAGEDLSDVVVDISGCGTAPLGKLLSAPVSVTVECISPLSSGKFRGNIRVRYTTPDEIEHTVTGRITVTVK
jgi:hypothetical protein